MVKERSQRRSSYHSFIIRLLKSFILYNKIIEAEHFPSSEDCMSAAINQVDQLTLTPSTFYLFTHSEHFPSKWRKLVSDN